MCDISVSSSLSDVARCEQTFYILTLMLMAVQIGTLACPCPLSPAVLRLSLSLAGSFADETNLMVTMGDSVSYEKSRFTWKVMLIVLNIPVATVDR